MPAPVWYLIPVVTEVIKSVTEITSAKTLADRDVAIHKYKMKQISLKEKYKASVEIERIKTDQKIEYKKINETKQIILALIKFSEDVFNKKYKYLEDSKDKISELFRLQIEKLDKEKRNYEKKLYSENNDDNKKIFYEKRIGEIDLLTIELDSSYKKSMFELNKIMKNLSAPVLPFNTPEFRKSIRLLEK